MRTIHWVQSVCLFLFLALALVYIGARTAKPHIVTPPRPPLPAKNGYDLLTAATKKMPTKEGFDDVFSKKPKHMWTLAEKRALLSQNQEALSAMKDSLRYPYLEENHMLSLNDESDEYKLFRQMARTIRFAGNVAWEEGRKAEAIDYYLDSVAIGRRIPHRVGLEGRDTGTLCENIARHDLWTHLEQIDTDIAVIALKRLEALDSEKLPFWETLEEEKYSALRMAIQAIEHPEQIRQTKNEEGTDKSEDSSRESGPSYVDIVPHKYIIDTMSDHYDKLIAQSKKPYIEGNKDISPPKEAYTNIFAPIPSGKRERYTVSIAGDALIRTALAIRIYQARNGKLPIDLNELVTAKLMARVLEDPFAKPGTPLQYKPLSGGKYLLYSIGPDGIDDGGKGIERKENSTRTHKIESIRLVNWDSKGDMVAGWYPY